MEWFNQIGNYANMFPGAPALALDFALNGPAADQIGYGLVYNLQAAPEQIDVYPPDELDFGAMMQGDPEADL